MTEARPAAAVEVPALKSIESSIKPGETLMDVFQKHGLRIADLFAMKQAAASVHTMRQVHPGQPYRFTVDQNNDVNSFTYGIDDNTVLKIERDENGFSAQKLDVPYESRVLTLKGQIEDNLSAALGDAPEAVALAMSISDILAWDVDFTTDLRRGDSVKVIVEALYLHGAFRKYGRIIAVEFVNDGRIHKAYLFHQEGREDYFDPLGHSMKKAFLKAPLSFRRISSSFSRSRLHPILKIRRPHHGIDYVAPTGTPVSATADGRVSFAGRKGAYGKLVMVSHKNGLQTCYGHLSQIAQGVRAGRQIAQGDLVGHVGSTGRSTGPHLHYEMRQCGRPFDPAAFKEVAGDPVPRKRMSEFQRVAQAVDRVFASAVFDDVKNTAGRQKGPALAFKKDLLPN